MRDVTRLPKAHLHVHLESSIRWSTLGEIGAANGVAVPENLGNGPRAFADFREFAELGALIRNCLCRPEDFTRIAHEFCEDEAAQGTRYVEVTFTAAAHGERLGRPEMPLQAVLRGLAEGQAACDIECRAILDHSRRRSVDRAWQTLDLATRYADDGVIGIGLAGDEAYPLEPFAEVCDAAADTGIHLIHHAGETRGAASIREAIERGGTERIGHGIHALDDEDLIGEIRKRDLALEVCPSSNVALGVADELAAHPLARLREAGLTVTVNSDIPVVVGTTLTDEYVRVRDAFGYDDTLLAELARAAADASFAPTETKARLHRETDAWLAAG